MDTNTIETSEQTGALSVLTGMGGDTGAEATEATTSLVETSTKAKKGKAEVLPPDPISQTIHKIENMTADEARSFANTLTDNSSHTYFQLGGVFDLVNRQKLYAEWGHPSFKDYAMAEHATAYRKAMYLINIYTSVVEMGLTWDQIKDLGWTKTMTLLGGENNPVTKENFDEWAAKAKKLTVNQLVALMEGQKQIGSEGGAAIEQDETAKVTTLTFKLHQDQKELIRSAIEKAKEYSGTKHDTVALEMIASDFMGKSIQVQTPSLVDVFKSSGQDAVLQAFEEAFPDITLQLS